MHRSEHSKNRRAIVMWIVLSIAVVMAILMFSFNMIVRQRNAQAHLIYYGQVAYGLAESGINLSWSNVLNKCNDKNSDLYKLLVQTSCENISGEEIDIPLDPLAVDLLIKDLNNAALSVTAQIESATLMNDDPFKGLENIEKFVILKVISEGSFGGIKKRVIEARKLRVQMDILPVLSKFTLFIKNPEIEDSISGGYNLFANDINGRPDTETVSPSSNYIPLILYNHGNRYASLEIDIDQSGWVFMGGDRVVKLNLTSGGDFEYGEYFHFYDFLQRSNAKQASFINDSPPPFFNDSHDVNGVSHHYYLKHVIYGYFTVDEGDPPGSMNKKEMLDYYFEAGMTMRSSTLHLFGTPLCPSPTRVFGYVGHSYPIYSGITVDIDGDKQRDGLVTLLPAIQSGSFSQLSQTAPIPSTIKNLGNRDQTISLDTDILAYDSTFQDETTYMNYASLIVESEPYNTAIDYMLGKGEFPPQERVLDENLDYPNDGSDIAIKCADGKSYFEGNLNNITGEYLRERCFIECVTADEFLKNYVTGNILKLGCHVYIATGNLHLPENLEVLKGGAIVCDQSIKFDGVKCEEGERLSLISINGNIYSEFNNSSVNAPSEVDLIALKGRVGSTNSNHQMHIKGTVAVKKIMPSDFKAGGTIVYPLECNPTGDERINFTKVHLSDLAEFWSF